MTNDNDFKDSIKDITARPAKPVKKDTAGRAAVQGRPAPPTPGPLVPKAPFGMPSIMPVAKNIKPLKPTVVSRDKDETET